MPIHNLYFKTLSLILFIHAGEPRIITAYIALQWQVLSWFVSTHAERTVSCRQSVNSFVCFCYFKGLFKCFIETTAVTWQPSQGAPGLWGARVRRAKSPRSELCDNALGRWAFKHRVYDLSNYILRRAATHTKTLKNVQNVTYTLLVKPKVFLPLAFLSFGARKYTKMYSLRY